MRDASVNGSMNIAHTVINIDPKRINRGATEFLSLRSIARTVSRSINGEMLATLLPRWTSERIRQKIVVSLLLVFCAANAVAVSTLMRVVAQGRPAHARKPFRISLIKLFCQLIVTTDWTNKIQTTFLYFFILQIWHFVTIFENIFFFNNWNINMQHHCDAVYPGTGNVRKQSRLAACKIHIRAVSETLHRLRGC